MPSQPKPFRNLGYLPLKIGFFLISVLSKAPYPVLIKLGRLLGKLFYLLAKRRTTIARINVQRCFPELSTQEVEQLVKQNCESTAIGLFETALCWFNPQALKKISTVKGLEHFDAAISAGRPVILLSYHLTSLEIGGSIIAVHRDIGAMYRPNDNPFVEHVMRTGRLGVAKQLFKRDEVRQAVKHLKQGKVIWYAIDQDNGKKQSVFVPFFNIQTATVTATTKFVKLSGAVVLPLTQARRSDGSGVDVEIHPPLDGFEGQDETKDALAVNQFIEHYLKKHPADYLWIHRRFKTRPDGELAFYPERKRRRTMGENKFQKLLLESSAAFPNTKTPRLLTLKDHQYVIVLYAQRRWMPLSWFKPTEKTTQSLRKNAFQLEVLSDYVCASRHCYVLTIRTRDEKLVEHLEQWAETGVL